jgi:arylformamidase
MNKDEWVDLNHVIEHEMITYQGLPGPVICDYWSREYSAGFYEEGTSFQIGKIEMVANTGTYIDTPFHRYEEGKDLSEILLDRIADIPGIVIHVPFQQTREISPEYFHHHPVNGKAVLIRTGWDRYWRTDHYAEYHPFLNQEAAEYLLEQKVTLVGIDSYNIDDTRIKMRPAHTILLKNNICIVEHMTHLDRLTGKSFRFFAIPPRIARMGSFPVRAFARLNS